MSTDQLKRLPSLQGYLNLSELKTITLKALGAGSITALLLSVLTILLENAGTIYVGPGAAIVVSLASTLAALLRARQAGIKFMQEGEQP